MTKTRILYNDACPICSREIKHYDKLAQRDGLPLAFDGLHDNADHWGIDPDAAARQLHVAKEGEILTGFDAFTALWSEIPRYRWLATCARLPIVRPVVAFTYNRVAAPLLYRLHKRRQRRAVSG